MFRKFLFFFMLGNLLLWLVGDVFLQAQYCPRYKDVLFSQVLKLNNIYYGQNRDLDLQLNNLVLDFFTPVGDNLSKRPLVILLHGGDFISGSKNNPMMLALCDSLARRGYTCASLDYTLLPSTNPFLYSGDTLKFLGIYKAQQDAKAAVRYFKKNAAVFKIDTSKIFLGGTSAGAAAAVHAAYMDQKEVYSFIDTLKFESIDKGNNGSLNYSSDFKSVVNLWGYISDTAWIEPGDKSIVSVHGLEDSIIPCGRHYFSPLIPYAGSCAMKTKLEESNIENSFLSYPDLGHGHATTSGKMRTTVDAIATFLYNEVALCALPKLRKVDKITPVSARISWQAASNAEQYIIRIRLKEDSIWTNLFVNSGVISQKNINALQYDRDYVWQIRSECDSLTPCPSLFSAEDTFHTRCYLPLFASSTVYSPTSALLEWGEVAGVQAYFLRGKKVGNMGWLNLYFSRFQTSKQVFGLQPNTQYQWQVKAICDTTEPIFSQWTEMEYFTTNAMAKQYESEPVHADNQPVLEVFPNPANRFLSMKISCEQICTINVQLYSSMGELVFISNKTFHPGSDLQLDLKNLPSGIYYLQVEGGPNAVRIMKKIVLLSFESPADLR